MKTLSLVLKKKWYDMIASGEKTEEYREIKPYWIKRLIEERDPSCHDDYKKITSLRAEFLSDRAIMLQYYLEEGLVRYKDFDTVTFQIKDIAISRGRTKWGAEDGEDYFVIELGKRL